MLDSTDKEFIRKEIEKSISKAVDDGQAYQKIKGKNKKRFLDLQGKVRKGDDSLAERMEFERLKRMHKLLDRLEESGVSKGAKGVAAGVGAIGKGVANSQLGKGALNAFMYSNPVTAMIAMNSDLFKVAGKGLGMIGKGAGKLLGGIGDFAYQKFKKKDPKSQAQSLITSKKVPAIAAQPEKLIAMPGTRNYIMAKQAMFVGGKNYITIGTGGFNSFTPINGMDNQNLVINKKSLNLPDGPVIDMITKNNKAQLIEAKTTNKLLGAINKRALLIGAGVILAVAAIGGLAAFLYSQINKGKKPKGNSINPLNQIAKYKELSQSNFNDTREKIQSGINNESKITDMKEFNKFVTKGNNSYDTGIRSGYTAKSKEGSVYRAPFDLKIKSFKENNKKLGVINIIAEKISRGINKDIEIMNITNPVVYPEQIVKKNQPIGLIGPGGDIFIKDISKKDFEEYLNNVNALTESNDKAQFDFDEKTQSIINSNFDTMARQKQATPNSDAFSNNSNKAYLDQQEKIRNNNNRIARESLQRAIDEGYNGTTVNGRWIPKDKLQTELNKLNDYSKNNKNAETGKQQAIKATPQNSNKVYKNDNTKVSSNNNVAVNPSKTRERHYGLSFPMDVAVANSDRLALTC